MLLYNKFNQLERVKDEKDIEICGEPNAGGVLLQGSEGEIDNQVP
ncbi:hypothetical protein ACFLUO_02625 [Chloroflexota bacterium]